MATVRKVFETNTFGMMVGIQSVLPTFRASPSGLRKDVNTSPLSSSR